MNYKTKYLEIKKKFLLKGGSNEQKISDNDVNNQDETGQTQLHKACVQNDIALVISLLEQGPNVNIHDEDDHTPLHLACLNNNLEIVKILLKNGANVNIQTEYGKTPLHYACSKNNLEIVKILLKHDAQKSFNIQDEGDSTPLFLACFKNNIDIVNLLIDKGAKESVNIQNQFDITPLSEACFQNNIDIVNILLANGARECINIVDDFDRSALCRAFFNQNKNIINILLENGADLLYVINTLISSFDYIGSYYRHISTIIFFIKYYCNKDILLSCLQNITEKRRKNLLLLYIFYKYSDYSQIDEDLKQIISDINQDSTIPNEFINKIITLFENKSTQKSTPLLGEECKKISSNRAPLLFYNKAISLQPKSSKSISVEMEIKVIPVSKINKLSGDISESVSSSQDLETSKSDSSKIKLFSTASRPKGWDRHICSLLGETNYIFPTDQLYQ